MPTNSSLKKRDFQLFMKRLRKYYTPQKIRFFHCGEYGDKNGRPHYHAAIFGLDFFEGRKLYKNSKIGDPLYSNPTLDKVWGKGLAVFGELTFASAAYIARYIMKKQTGDQADAHYSTLCPITGEPQKLKPEYITMSRKPGIGTAWISRYMDEVYPDDFLIMNGKPSRPPKFYDVQYEKMNPEGFKQLKATRKTKGLEYEADNTPDRIEVKELVQQARLTQLAREL